MPESIARRIRRLNMHVKGVLQATVVTLGLLVRAMIWLILIASMSYAVYLRGIDPMDLHDFLRTIKP